MGPMIGSGIITFVLTSVSAVGFLFMLILALNGFMGQDRAVNASFGTYVVLAGLIVLAATALSILSTGFLKRRLNWHAVLAVLLSSVGLSVIAGLLHFACVIIAAIVAEATRTGR